MGLWKDIFHTDINKREEELLPWEKSHRFIDMTQSEFDKAYDLSIESAINSGRINNYQEGVVVAFLSYFHAIDKLSDLYELRKHFIQGCNYVENGKCGEPLNDIVEFFEHEFNLKKEGAERYKSDYPVLVKLKSLIDTEIESAEPLDKYVFKLMSRDLSRCIKRAEGAAKI